MTTIQLFLLTLAIIFAVPFALWISIGAERRIPFVVAQILTGVLLGPSVLGRVAPEYYAFLFKPGIFEFLTGVASWGAVLFVWVAGVELDLGDAWRHRRDTGVAAGLALGVPLLLGAAAGALLLVFRGWMGPHGHGWQMVLAIGMACSVTALPILVLFLEQLELLHRPLGQRVLRYASCDDLAIWLVLALILLDGARLGRQLAYLPLFAACSIAVRALMLRLRPADRWVVAMIWLAASGFAADWAGLHFMVGAFLSGAVLEAGWFDRARLDGFRATVLLALMPVFFLSTGLRTRFGVNGACAFGAAALLLAVSVGGKHLAMQIAARWLKWRPCEAHLIGWLLQTKALIMIIFANILLDRGVISDQTFTALLLMAVASTVLTMPMARRALSTFQARSLRSM